MRGLSRDAVVHGLRTFVWRTRYRSHVEAAGPRAIRGWVRLESKARGGRRLRVVLKPASFLSGPLVITGRGRFVLGPRSYVSQYAVIGVIDSVTIGADCMIGPHVGIRDNDHGFDDTSRPMRMQAMVAAPVTIEDDVWVGDGAVILKGVTIGRGAIVAAGAVVRSDVARWSIVGGVPARQIGTRSAN